MVITLVVVGTRGDVEPHLALAVGLKQSGFNIRMAAPLDFEEQITTYGVEFIPINVSLKKLYDSEAADGLLSSEINAIKLITRLKQTAGAVVGQIINDTRVACNNTDVVMYSPLALSSHYFAKDMGAISFPTCLQPLGRTVSFPAPVFDLKIRLPGFLNRFSYHVMEQGFWQVFRRYLDHKHPALGHFNNIYRPGNHSFFAISPLVVPRPPDYTPSMHMTGFWRFNEANNKHSQGWEVSNELEEFIKQGPPPICIGFGSMKGKRVSKIMRLFANVVREQSLRAIVLTGWSFDPYIGSIFDKNNVFLTEQIPHSWLFPRVSVIVHHGGAGTVAAALYAGKPSLIIPFFFDQSYWANLLNKRKLGPAPLNFRLLSTSSILSGLNESQNPDLLANINAVHRDLKKEDGVTKTVDIIQEII